MVNLPSDSSQKAKYQISLAFPGEPKLFLKAAGEEGDSWASDARTCLATKSC